METGEREKDGPDPAADDVGKVVRIPRDWFGPKEDLVPFGPRATGLGNEVDPNTFWDESSNAIQHVVEAPRAMPEKVVAGRFVRAVPGGLVRGLPDGSGWRAIAVAVVVAAMAGVGIAGFLLGNPQRRELRSVVASVGAAHVGTTHMRVPARNLGTSTATIKGHRGLQIHAKPRMNPNQGQGHRASSSTATPVVYRSSQTHLSGATYEPSNTATGGTASGSGGGPGISGGPGTSATGSSAHAANQPSQPAFGADGALGPMSSPTG